MNKTFHNGNNKTHVNKFKGYYLDDCACVYCLYYLGEKQGCTLNKCCCEDEKQDAAANGRIKLKKGSLAWDG